VTPAEAKSGHIGNRNLNSRVLRDGVGDDSLLLTPSLNQAHTVLDLMRLDKGAKCYEQSGFNDTSMIRSRLAS